MILRSLFSNQSDWLENSDLSILHGKVVVNETNTKDVLEIVLEYEVGEIFMKVDEVLSVPVSDVDGGENVILGSGHRCRV
jgi:hypothetical protein